MRFNSQLKLAKRKELVDYLEGEIIMPVSLEISLTGRCNANCHWCFGVKEDLELDYEKLNNLLFELRALNVSSLTWTGGGEPTLYSKFSSVSDFTKQLGIKQGLITNGLQVNYDPGNFEWIRVSKTNKDFDINNLKILRQCKILGLCFNYTGEDDIKIIEQSKRDYDVNYIQVRPALKSKGELTNIKMPKIDVEVSEYKFIDARKERDYNKCEGYHFVPFLWQNGDLSSCAYHYRNPMFNLGNVYESSFLEIIEQSPSFIWTQNDCQICCKNHEINKLINDLRGLEDSDFI